MFLPSLLIKAYPIRSDPNNYKPRFQITSLPSSYFGNKNLKKKKGNTSEAFYQAAEMPMTTKTPQISQKWAERLSNWAMQIDLLLAGWPRRAPQAGADGDHGEEEEVDKQWQWGSI